MTVKLIELILALFYGLMADLRVDGKRDNASVLSPVVTELG